MKQRSGIVAEPNAAPAPAPPAGAQPPDIVDAPVPDTLKTLQVNPETGLTSAEVEVRRKANG